MQFNYKEIFLTRPIAPNTAPSSRVIKQHDEWLKQNIHSHQFHLLVGHKIYPAEHNLLPMKSKRKGTFYRDRLNYCAIVTKPQACGRSKIQGIQLAISFVCLQLSEYSMHTVFAGRK